MSAPYPTGLSSPPLSSRPTLLFRVASELGIPSIWSAPRDTKLLCLSRFVRLFAYGSSTLILALYLSNLGTSDTRIGLFMTLTLLGDVVISFLLTLVADGLGRRKILAGGAILMCASGVVFTFVDNYWILVFASVLGVISPSGNEIGPFKAIEESTLAQLTPAAIRSDIFAWYTLLGTAGTASGTLICGWLVQALSGPDHLSQKTAYRVIFGIYAVLGIVKLFLTLMLSDACEPEPPEQEYQEVVEMEETPDTEGLLSESSDEDDDREEVDAVNGKSNLKSSKKIDLSGTKATAKPLRVPGKTRKSIWPAISDESRVTVVKLCLLFAVDSFAGGLAPMSWIIYFFNQKYHVDSGHLGTLFFVTNIIAAISNLFASSLAKRIGLIKTMVFTHLPSAIFLALIPVPSPNMAWLAMIFLILRSCIQNMDQAPRQAFLSLAVLPSERTAVMGVVNVVRTLSQSGGPTATGWLAGLGKFWISFLIAGGLKASYDLGMLKMFLGYKGREEVEEDKRRKQQQPEMAGSRRV